MSKNNKKVPSLGSLIPLGQKNKPRPAATTQSAAKKPKIEDFSPSNLISTIEQSMKQDNGASETLIINFLNSMKSTLITSSKNGKILPSQCLALFCICKKFPNLFTKVTVVDCMCAILGYNGKESTNMGSSNFTQKLVQSHSVTAAKLKQLHIAICGMFLASFKDNPKWPIQLVKAYLDDSLGDRVWVDLPECNLFVRNIETAFPAPGLDPRTFFPLASISEPLSELHCTADINLASPDLSNVQDINAIENINKIISALTVDDLVKARFDHSKMSVDAMVAGYIKDIFERKFIQESQARNILRTFCSLAGLAEMRGAVVTKLDGYLMGKHQSVTLNMLTIMANSCNQNIAQNPHDIVFCVYLMIKCKYKTSKPPVQITLLECIKRISEMHPNNLRNMLHIYVNNELYNSPTVTYGVNINQVATSAITASSSVHSQQNKPISVTLPAIYFRFPSESIKILGDLLHEQLCIQFGDIKSVKGLIRDICRWIKFAHSNPGGIYNAFISTGQLPDCLELLDLAQSLLADRNANESLSSRMNNLVFRQTYVDNMINVLCELQMLSIIRPSVRESFKDKSDHEKKDLDSIKHHHTTLRQIRYLTCKWLKTVFRLMDSQIPSERMTFYLKQVMFLNVVRTNDNTYVTDESYAFNDVMPNETDKMTLVKGLTEIPLSEKLIQTMITLGFEKNLCYRPSEIVEMLSELIVRASASATTDIMPMNVTKGETIINNMFACCCYDIELEDTDPKMQVAKTLAYKSTFWKVCQALVIMACHCTETCGAFLWANYPTIKNLMKIVITNNFDNSNLDEESLETERQHCETDAAKIIDLECSLYGDTGEDAVMFDSKNSKLVNILMLNLPQGAKRLPPPDVLQSLKSINSLMKIGDRLSQCRSPDFLLEIVKSQDQTKVANRKWIIDLVKKTSEHNLEGLPLLCLTEFIYHDLHDKISNKLPMASTVDTFKRLVQQIRNTLAGSKSDSVDTAMRIVAAFSNSFFNRLGDAAASTRNIARECLFILLQPVGSPIAYMSDSAQLLDTLKTLVNVSLFQENAIICSIVASLKEALKFETDITVLCCYIELFASMSSGIFKEWLVGVVDTLAILILQRPLITDKLKSLDHNNMKNGGGTIMFVSDLLAEIFLTYVAHVQQAAAIAIEHQDKVVMVAWKEKKVPMTVAVVQSQLSFLCWGLVKSVPCKKLTDIWFIKSSKTIDLPQFSVESGDGPCDGVIPQWLVDSALCSGQVPVMTAIMNYHVRHNHAVTHILSPAMLFMPQDFIIAYIKIMNAQVKEDSKLVEAWLASVNRKNSVLTTLEKMQSKAKRTSSIYLDLVRTYCKDGGVSSSTKASFEPNIIVKPLVREAMAPTDNMMDTSDESGKDKVQDERTSDSVWSGLVHNETSDQAKVLSITKISGAVARLLETDHAQMKNIIGHLLKLLKDSKTHSDTLRLLNKSDYRLLPLLRLTFRGMDQDSYDFCVGSFHYLFNSYPHIEKLSVWKMAYNLCQIEGLGIVSGVNGDGSTLCVAREAGQGYGIHEVGTELGQGYVAMVKTLVTDILQGSMGDNDIADDKDCKVSSSKTRGKGAKIDQLTILGLDTCVATCDDSHEMVQRLLFSSHSVHLYSDYFMSDLIHQSHMDSLHTLLHTLLTRRTLTSLNGSRTLDFIEACVSHPRLECPVVLPSHKRALWPDPVSLSDQELVSLLTLVVSECHHLVQHHGLHSAAVDQSLGRRCRLVETMSGHRPRKAIKTFLESRPHDPTVEKLSFALYSRLPGLGGSRDRDQALPLGAFDTEMLHRVGTRVLSGLINARGDTQDSAIQACKALVLRHGPLAVQLLPHMVALSDGALDTMECWTTFKKKRGNMLYSCLLHMLELMAPYSLTSEPTIRTDVTATLGNFLRLLIRYRDQPTVFSAMVTRLVDFIESLVTYDDGGGGGEHKTNFVADHFAEISALSRIYQQFKNLIGYGHRVSQDSTTTAGPSVATSADEAASGSRSLAAQLDSLDRFRTDMKQYQFVSGVGHTFKLLTVGGGGGGGGGECGGGAAAITGLCMDDLRASLGSAVDEVRNTARQYITRYLNQCPERAAPFIADCLVPNMMRGVYYWSRPFTNLALSTLRNTAMLAPDLTPACLSIYGRMFIAGNHGRGNCKDSVSLLEDILDNVSLESFMADHDISVTAMPSMDTVVMTTAGAPANAAGHKRHFQMSDHDAHKAKRSRFK